MKDLIYLEGAEGMEKLASYAVARNLIPFFGAGFSAGAEALNGSVPDCTAAQEYMKKALIEENPECANYLAELDFTGIAGEFYNDVSELKRARYFEDNFTDVKLGDNLKAFLHEIDWPYAYTINFDDGIEQSVPEGNTKFRIVLPYRGFRKPRSSVRLLYKLHGDAEYECRYYRNSDRTVDKNIIFSSDQYLQSITDEENRDMLNALKSDFSTRIVLFIGCSLQDEQDIRFVYNQCKEECTPGSMRIVVRTEKPSVTEKGNLMRHGISHVLLVDNYVRFYTEFLNKYKELKEQQSQIYRFYNPAIRQVDDKQEALELLSHGTAFNTERNSFDWSKLYVTRDITVQVIQELESYDCMVIEGRRFSGKTAVLCEICKKTPQYGHYYFPSKFVPDEQVVTNLITNTKQGLFLFDSNSISHEVYHYIIDSSDLIKQNGHKIIIAINSSDNNILSKMLSKPFSLRYQFSSIELRQNQNKADELGLSRRKTKQTNVDYVLLLAENNTIDLAFMPKDKTVYSLHESVLLIILAALDKVYDADAIALGIPMYEVGTFITKVGEKLAQRELCSPDEATKHSAMKLVHNSKFALLKIVNGLDEEQVIESVFHIVQRCQHDYTRKRLYINVMLFDTLNQLFQDSPKRAELIKKIYDKLSELLYSDMHYWLQRAKCTYRHAKEQSALETAYTYAKKSYDDGGQDIHYKASLTLSIICCAISEHEKGQDKINECRLAIRYANEAVFSDFYQQNNTSLQLDLDAKQGKSHSGIQMVVNACNFIKQNSTDMEDVEISESVLDRLHKLFLEKNS